MFSVKMLHIRFSYFRRPLMSSVFQYLANVAIVEIALTQNLNFVMNHIVLLYIIQFIIQFLVQYGLIKNMISITSHA